MRLDQYLSQTRFSSRARAQDAIQEGRVLVNGKPVLKNSFPVGEADEIRVLEKEQDFVSRAGGKLFDALDEFGVILQDRVVLDVGASTGGFTDVCLKKGARLVYALDVGHDQLHESLRQHPRCVNLEGHNAKEIEKAWFEEPVDFFCMDVSFISCLPILDAITRALGHREGVLLVKPQFEAGPAYLNKHGVLRNDNVIIRVLKEVCAHAQGLGYGVWHLRQSSVIGRDGNREYVLHLKPEPATILYDFRAIVLQ